MMCGWRDSNPHAEAPDPKSGVSTNFTTPAPFEGRKGTRFFSPVNLGERQWNTFSTWQHPEHGGLVQIQVRIRGREDWDVRFQGQPHKRSVWRWSMWGTHETFMGGIHLRHEALKASWWMWRDRSGEQAFARHVEGAWGEGGLRQWGVFALDGQGDWRGAYVMVRALDGRVWSRTPNMGWRMGVWVTQQRAREASWTAQCSWSPSQQETFRCAWRWRWEP